MVSYDELARVVYRVFVLSTVSRYHFAFTINVCNFSNFLKEKLVQQSESTVASMTLII